jgi:aspartyl-tRNA(Asn)/glutamyl-tRNA(Gln) amidotransferase subunit A
VSRFGLIDLIPSMECCGLLSGSLKHIGEILKTIAGQDGLDFSLPDEKTPDFSPRRIDPHKTTIGVITEAQTTVPADEEKLFRASLDDLKKAGFSLREMSFPSFPLFSLVHKIVGSVEASCAAGRYDSVRYGPRAPGAKNWNEMYLLSRGAAFGPLLKSYLFQGAFFQFERYEAFVDACRIRARLVAGMQRLTEQADFLVFPAVNGAPSGAPALLADTYAQFSSTAFANVTGQPALYLPPASGAGHSGFQLAGPRLSDGRLLALGEHLLNMRRGGH